MAICAWKNCNNWFDDTKTNRGQKRKYCGRQCNIYATRENQNKSRLKARHAAKRKISAIKRDRNKAREFAVLNCVLYRECNLNITMNCHRCQKKIIEMGAWRREPGTLYHNQEDLHVICLPSAGRG